MDFHVKYSPGTLFHPIVTYRMKALSTVILDIPNGIHVSFGELRAELSRLRGVERVDVNLVMEKVTVDFDPSKSSVNEIRAVVAANAVETKDDDKQTRHVRSRR